MDKTVKEKKVDYPEMPFKIKVTWFSWESPTGLSLGWGIFFVSTCLGIYLLHLAGVIK